tara:strand:+ start:98 stop:307 length:210 start_codon:yes stop_codon:yes gene_type:complete
MKLSVLLPEHHKHMLNKYERLYKLKYPWAGDELKEVLIKGHIDRVVSIIDEKEYLKETSTKEFICGHSQ